MRVRAAFDQCPYARQPAPGLIEVALLMVSGIDGDRSPDCLQAVSVQLLVDWVHHLPVQPCRIRSAGNSAQSAAGNVLVVVDADKDALARLQPVLEDAGAVRQPYDASVGLS